MADVSRRSLNKFTYAPIKPNADDLRSGAVERRRRGLEKIAFVNALRFLPEEIEALRTAPSRDEQWTAALDAIREATARSASARAGWRELGKIPAGVLVKIARSLAARRRQKNDDLRKLVQALQKDHAAQVRGQLERRPTSVSTGGRAPERAVGNPWKAEPVSPSRSNAAALKPDFGAAFAWARVRSPERADTIVAAAREVMGLSRVPDTRIDWDRFGIGVATNIIPDWTDTFTDGFEERMKVEPIGRLHLERIDMTPVGIIRGELVHSVGLAPGETVTVIHREWSSRETSFEKVVAEEFEQSTEDGVTENTELASATEIQSRHSSALSMEATASGSYGFASASITLGYNATSENEVAKRDSRNHAVEVTRKASARTRKEHKSTFTVKEQAGVEDQSTRTLTNVSPNDPMRVDFHQMVRDWKVDLYRYGLRLTYDIVIPAPGMDLLANVDELRRIEYQLNQAFDFPLTPAEITREGWSELVAQYGGDLDAPPPEFLRLHGSKAFPYQGVEEAEARRFDLLEFDVPEGYTVFQGHFIAYVTLYSGGHFDVMEDLAAPIGHHVPEKMQSYESPVELLNGRTGHIAIVMVSEGVQAGQAQATIEVKHLDQGWIAWQNSAWSALRKGAESQWQIQRQGLQQRRDQLTEELGKWDPLTLRRMEREEIMKMTLKWIFGPTFDLMPEDVAALYGGSPGALASLEPATLTSEQWAQVMGLGEFIKFLHQSIEWENVLYFVYPYFWDNRRNHALKRFLHHPDSIHQSFLRGGAARVVLTVRPGFEDSFTRLFEGMDENEDATGHPYLTIAQEIRAYANTNYPGIPGADDTQDPDPAAVEKGERGKRIAQWHEYTPVSALDITVNTPLNELK